MFWQVCSKKKNTGLKRSTLCGHHMTTGFDLFELPIRGLLQKGLEHSPPRFCFEEPSFLVGTAIAMGIHSAVNIRATKQIWGWVNGCSYHWGKSH